ncbi:type II toxin-antitoxin system VapC family toxin [Candidatus Halobeggiatoa sp. HSG11]|nr:type II toxin-antitoxin system VapC family toxin [Candidatus Halobeggiatoa sp. HSG11]
MIYLDTSFIVPRYVEEESSQFVEQFLLTCNEIAISYWTYVEFNSMLARRIRMDDLDENSANQIMAMFEHDMNSSFYILVPTISDYKLASCFLQKPHTGLRAGDALHLAIAHNNKIKFYTFDKLLLQIAPQLNIEIGSL